MEILRIFNNNVVLARADHGGEVIVTGRGLGFQAKPGQRVDQERVAKVFVPENGRDPDNFGALVAAVPPEHLVLADRALDVARAELGVTLGSTTVIALADHLGFAVVRHEKNIPMSYPLRGEVVHMYPREYAAAAKVLAYVNAQLDHRLVADEAVAIALHLVNAGFASGDLSFTYQMTGVFTQLFDIMGVEYEREFDRDSVNAARFITHLRYFFVRATTGRQLEERSGKLREAIRDVYPDAHATAVKLQAVLELRLGVPLTDDEVTYLTLHVARMVDEVRPTGEALDVDHADGVPMQSPADTTIICGRRH